MENLKDFRLMVRRDSDAVVPHRKYRPMLLDRAAYPDLWRLSRLPVLHCIIDEIGKDLVNLSDCLRGIPAACPR